MITRPWARSSRSIRCAASVEAQVEAVMHEAFALHALTGADLVHEVDRRLLEDGRPDGLLNPARERLSRMTRLDPAQMQQMGKQQARGPRSDDTDLRPHPSEPALVLRDRPAPRRYAVVGAVAALPQLSLTPEGPPHQPVRPGRTPRPGAGAHFCLGGTGRQSHVREIPSRKGWTSGERPRGSWAGATLAGRRRSCHRSLPPRRRRFSADCPTGARRRPST